MEVLKPLLYVNFFPSCQLMIMSNKFLTVKRLVKDQTKDPQMKSYKIRFHLVQFCVPRIFLDDLYAICQTVW